MLVESQIAPGAKLNERELAEVLNVRAPAARGHQDTGRRGTGGTAAQPRRDCAGADRADVLNTFEVMAGLEAQSGELAAQRITDAELVEIKAMHFEMMAAWTRRDLSNTGSIQIHSAINAAAKNRVLTATYQQVNAGCRRCASAPTRTKPSGSAP